MTCDTAEYLIDFAKEKAVSLPEKLLRKYLDRFDELIGEGEAIRAAMKTWSERRESFITHTSNSVIRHKIDWSRFVEWRTKCRSLLTAVTSPGSTDRHDAEDFGRLSNKKDHLEYAIAFLKGMKDNLEGGFLDGLVLQIEAEAASDYMGQAEELLREGQSGKFNHVPAAVLAGAVLERALRAVCARQKNPIPTRGENGEPLKLNRLIDDLKKAGTFNEAKAKQLRAWAALRNHAAHGEFDEFKRPDVEVMLKSISDFLARDLP